MLDAGREVDRYVVEGELGRGGMAVVYRVRHITLDTLHAMKVLTLAGPVVAQRLLEEGRVQARLRHPNVVPVTDALVVDGHPALVMEFVDGPGLDQLVAAGELDTQTALELFRGVLDGVEEAHAHGMVHRDLKPSNVLIDARGGRSIARVTDFGIAKALEPTEARGFETRSGMAMGTPGYMAPEQFKDAKHVDQRADVWSLGCILYELVCGRLPFAGPDMLTIFSEMLSGRYPDPKEQNEHVPDEVVTAIHGCLRLEPSERIGTCAELRDVLDGAAFEVDLPAMGSTGGAPDTLYDYLDEQPEQQRHPPTLAPAEQMGHDTLHELDRLTAPAPSRNRTWRVVPPLLLLGIGGAWWLGQEAATDGVEPAQELVPVTQPEPTEAVLEQPEPEPEALTAPEPQDELEPAAPTLQEPTPPEVSGEASAPAEPAPEPPKSEPPTTFAVTVKGEVGSAKLSSNDQTWRLPADVPAGAHTFTVVFADNSVATGTFLVDPSKDNVLTCSAARQFCR